MLRKTWESRYDTTAGASMIGSSSTDATDTSTLSRSSREKVQQALVESLLGRGEP